MSRRNIKPTTFHDDSRSSDTGSVVAAPSRSKQRNARDSAKDLLSLRDNKVDSQQNGHVTSGVKQPVLGADGEIQVPCIKARRGNLTFFCRSILIPFQWMRFKSINDIIS
jgi:hypothetical protein